jgi:hypothetical protein
MRYRREALIKKMEIPHFLKLPKGVVKNEEEKNLIANNEIICEVRRWVPSDNPKVPFI